MVLQYVEDGNNPAAAALLGSRAPHNMRLSEAEGSYPVIKKLMALKAQ